MQNPWWEPQDWALLKESRRVLRKHPCSVATSLTRGQDDWLLCVGVLLSVREVPPGNEVVKA